MANKDADDTNPQCRASDQEPDDDELAEFNKRLTSDFDVLPLFESQYFDFVNTKRYSMTTNEKLRTRWHDRVLSEKRKSMPKTMPNINDYHFHNCRTKFLPSASLCNYPPPRKHLQPGPGVDKYGQRPIPDDMTLKIPRQAPPKSAKNKTKISKKEQKESKKL